MNTGHPDGDLIFMNSSQVAKYSNSRELAYGPANGQMYDREMLDRNTVCYLKPWESKSDCRTFQGAYNDDSGSVQVTPIMASHAVPKFEPTTDREHYLGQVRPMSLDKNYQINFLPNRFNGSAPALWITEQDYHNLVDNIDEKKKVEAKDTFRRRLRIYSGKAPLPHPTKAYSSDAITASAIKAFLEQDYGIISSLTNVRLSLGDSTAPAGYLATDLLDKFLTKCELSATGNGSSAYPHTGLQHRTRFNLLKTDGLQPMRHAGNILNHSVTKTPIYPTAVICTLYLAPDNVYPNGLLGSVDAYITHYGLPADGSGNLLANYAVEGTNRMLSWGEMNGARSTPLTPPLLSLNDGSPVPIPGDHTRTRHNSSLELSIRIGMVGGRYNDISLRTRYYDTKKVKFRNKVSKVQAFLFANQFVSYAYSSEYDRQLRLHGGIVAKDIFGRFTNFIGPERKKIRNRFISPALHTSVPSSQWGVFPALFVISDPRFQYTTELIGSDMLNVIAVE